MAASSSGFLISDAGLTSTFHALIARIISRVVDTRPIHTLIQFPFRNFMGLRGVAFGLAGFGNVHGPPNSVIWLKSQITSQSCFSEVVVVRQGFLLTSQSAVESLTTNRSLTGGTPLRIALIEQSGRRLRHPSRWWLSHRTPWPEGPHRTVECDGHRGLRRFPRLSAMPAPLAESWHWCRPR